MKKINFIYLFTFILAIVLYFIYTNVQNDAAFFYGFAENKETEISHDKNVLIDKIMVTTGQKVKKGELLLIVKNEMLPLKMDEVEIKKQLNDFRSTQDIKQIRHKISELNFSKRQKTQEIIAKINELNHEISLNKSLYEGLKTINKKEYPNKSPKEEQVELLVEQMNSISSDYENEIAYQEELLQAQSKPAHLERELLDQQMSELKYEEQQLSIYAPSDGIIGNITCKEDEYISSFNTLINFYQRNPTLVKGFVHESLLLQVKIGNELEVTSSMHSDHKVIGKVIGLGSRIVEIPSRLRKMPDIVTYGREVMISIPADNNFLQKEKVMLNVAP